MTVDIDHIDQERLARIHAAAEPDDELRARREREVKPANIAQLGTDAGYGPGGGYRLTELGNARRLADANRDRLRYVRAWGKWLAWDGQRWRPDDTAAAHQGARNVVASIYTEASALAARQAAAVNAGTATSGAPIDDYMKWARASSKRAGIENMLALAQTEPEFLTSTEQLDRDIWLLNVANGTIDLRTGELQPHRQADMLTKLAGAAYDGGAAAPSWERFLERVQPDPEVRAWLQRYLGYALTGDVREQCLAFLVGAGANGKSVMLDVVLALLGDYGLRAAPDLVLASHNERHPTELSDLDGKRLVVCSEIEQGRQWAESTIKRITGDTTITARRMKQDFYTFTATHKLIIAANTRPTVRGTDAGIWRRMRLVPFAVQIPSGEQDRELAQRLIADEAPGILAWLVRGCLAWQREGLGMPTAIASATLDYRADQDLLGRWIEDCCELGATLWHASSSLFANYRAWCDVEGLTAWTQPTWFARMLEGDGIAKSKRERGTVRVLTGIQVRGVR